MAKSHLSLVSPTTENRTVTPLRRPNAELRTREHLTADEVEALMTAAKGNRYGHRDATAILLAYRHGLRACELVDLRWSDVHLTTGTLYVRRAKNGKPTTHPLLGNELRALRRLQREQAPASPFVFTSERGASRGSDRKREGARSLLVRAALFRGDRCHRQWCALGRRARYRLLKRHL
jgi:integrase